MHRFALLLSLGLLLLGPRPAAGDLASPIRLHLTDAPRFARPGVPFSGTLRVAMAADLSAYPPGLDPSEITQLQIVGSDWQVLSFSPPASTFLSPGQSIDVPFQVVSNTPDAPLTFQCRAGSSGSPRRVRHSFELGTRSYLRSTQPGASLSLSGLPQLPGVGPTTESRHLDLEASVARARLNPAGTTLTIGVSGYVTYVRETDSRLGADSVLVQIWDEDSGDDDLMVTTTTDRTGYFSAVISWDPSVEGEDKPDLYITYATINPYVSVYNGTWTSFGTPYGWRSSTVSNVDGSLVYFGYLTPADLDDHAALGIHTDITRAARWLKTRGGFDTPPVRAYWPDGDWAYYSPDEEAIHLSDSFGWEEDTHTHEYGHHWMKHFGHEAISDDYCNGTCDDDVAAGDCGHCRDCPEAPGWAWVEGWPNWLADVVTRSWDGDYGHSPLYFLDGESPPSVCSESGVAPDPGLTEDYIHALLRDIEDHTNDDNFSANVGQDELSLGSGEILEVTTHSGVTSAQSFIDEFLDTYPGKCREIWSLAHDLGFTTADLDFLPPDAVTLSGASSSHTIGVSSKDPTIEFLWGSPTDDCSGLSGYAVSVTTGATDNPGTTETLHDTGSAIVSHVTGILGAGSYYLHVRVRDRQGNWSVAAHDGPYVIAVPVPADLRFQLRLGWDFELVPRNAPDATGFLAPLPVALQSGSNYWNVGYRNGGGAGTGVGYRVGLKLDGKQVDNVDATPLAAGTSRTILNGGPVSVSTGRHTLTARLDGLEAIAEGTESNNDWGRQWCWQPWVFHISATAQFDAPPPIRGGWDQVNDGRNKYFNCTGFEVVAAEPWTAVCVTPLAPGADYDCRLHEPITGPDDESGFGPFLAWSYRDTGQIDALIFRPTPPATSQTLDVGVLNINDATSDYDFTRSTSATTLTAASSFTLTLAAGELLRLYELSLGPLAAGGVDVTLNDFGTDSGVHVSWVPASVTAAGLSDLTTAVVDAAGRCTLEIDTPGAGSHALVFWRDPAFGTMSAGGTGAAVVSVQINATPRLEFPPFVSGWHSPLVPRAMDDGTPSSVPYPDTLLGDVPGTWLNYALRNSRDVAATQVLPELAIDGAPAPALPLETISGLTNIFVNRHTPYVVRGGRHALTMTVDDVASPDPDPAGNVWGEQFAWSPVLLAPGATLARSSPPDPLAGEVTAGTLPRRFNCDGLRFQPSASAWCGVAVLPFPGGDVDLRLHDVAPGANLGFRTPRAVSAWGPDASDFILVNNTVQAPPAGFDVGIIRAGEVQQGYYVHQALSIDHGAQFASSYGPYSMNADTFLALHTFDLHPGTHVFSLRSDSGTIDWGLSLHRNDLPIVSKSQTIPGGLAFLRPAGEGEFLSVTIVEAGTYGLAVWKAGSADAGLGGTYTLFVDPVGGEAVAAQPVARDLRIVAVSPNPASGLFRVQFESPQPGGLSVEIHDAAGRRIRGFDLVFETAGRHELVWNGQRDGGEPAPNGIYFLRLTSGRISDSRKVILLR